MLKIQAHIFRFNGKLDKGAGAGSIGTVEQYPCQLFQGLISGVGVVGCEVAFGTQLLQAIFKVRPERNDHRWESLVEDI